MQCPCWEEWQQFKKSVTWNKEDKCPGAFLFIYLVLSLLENNYNILMIFAIHQHESTIGIHMSPLSWTPSYLSPHPTCSSFFCLCYYFLLKFLLSLSLWQFLLHLFLFPPVFLRYSLYLFPKYWSSLESLNRVMFLVFGITFLQNLILNITFIMMASSLYLQTCLSKELPLCVSTCLLGTELCLDIPWVLSSVKWN